jgi:predicted secreted hydrolase
MNNRALGALLALTALLSGEQPAWKTAEPGYRYKFPRDYFSHPEYRVEWWYYTGNLHAPDGHRFGFELTFFRFGQHLSETQKKEISATWRPDELYLAHLAFSDLDGQEFFHTERLNRAGPGLAGASLAAQSYWNGNWQVRWTSLGSAEQQLEASSDRLRLRLTLQPKKPIIINGVDGISRKGPLPGEASHYLSFTRLAAEGDAQWRGRSWRLNGLAWMDHEFFTEPSDSALAGWDWFAIQLDTNQEFMLYRLRLKSGDESPFSSGTYIDAKGVAHHLSAADFELTPGDAWQSSQSQARYPMKWHIRVPTLDLELAETTALQNQELFSADELSQTYWEGAVSYSGLMHAQAVRGVGYLEMTGYAKPVQLSVEEKIKPPSGH